MSDSPPPRLSEIARANPLSLLAMALGTVSGIVVVHGPSTVSLAVAVIGLIAALIAFARRERVAKITVITTAVVVIILLVIRVSVGEL